MSDKDYLIEIKVKNCYDDFEDKIYTKNAKKVSIFEEEL